MLPDHAMHVRNTECLNEDFFLLSRDSGHPDLRLSYVIVKLTILY